MNKKIIFCIPKLHNNLLPWCNELTRNKFKIEYLTLRKNSILQKKVSVVPGFEILIIVLKKLGFIKNDQIDGSINDPAIQVDKFFIPSINYLFKKIRSEDTKYVFIRVYFGLFFMLSFLISIILNKKIILYSQGSFLTKKSFKKKIVYNFFKKLGVKFWITPVFLKCDLENDLKYYNTFIPFFLENRATFRLKSDKLKVLVIGKYTKRKQHYELLKSIYKNKLIDINFNFFGEVIYELDEYYKKCEYYKLKNKLNNVKLHKNVNYNNILDEFSKHDILVMMSDHERCSFSQIEAMSFGLACIIGKNNGSANYIINNVNGYVLESNNFNKVSQKLKFLNSNRKVLESYKKRSKQINNANKFISKSMLRRVFD